MNITSIQLVVMKLYGFLLLIFWQTIPLFCFSGINIFNQVKRKRNERFFMRIKTKDEKNKDDDDDQFIAYSPSKTSTLSSDSASSLTNKDKQQFSTSFIFKEWNNEKNQIETIYQFNFTNSSSPSSSSSSYPSPSFFSSPTLITSTPQQTFPHNNLQRKLFSFFPSFPTLLTIQQFLQKIFLPIGYPKTVPKEYFLFQKYNLLQDLCSYLRNIMATHAIFISIGLGKKESHTIEATLLWILRDGLSMMIGLIFTSINSQQFGIQIKKWRFFADFINNIGITFDMIAPFFHSQHLLLFGIISLGSICKCLCGITAGATNAVIFQYFSFQYNNISDILSKNHAQHTIISLLGLVLTMILTRNFTWIAKQLSLYPHHGKPNVIGNSIIVGIVYLSNLLLGRGFKKKALAEIDIQKLQSIFTWTCYTLLTVIHMLCNYRAVKILALNTFNPSRYGLLLESFFNLPRVQTVMERNTENGNLQHEIIENLSTEKFTPTFIATKEPVIFRSLGTSNLLSEKIALKAFISLKEAEKIYGPQFQTLLKEAVQLYQGENYLILVSVSDLPHSRSVMSLLFNRDATVFDQAKGFFEAKLIQAYFQNSGLNILQLTHLRQQVNQLFPIFWNILKQNGWVELGAQLRPIYSFSYSTNIS